MSWSAGLADHAQETTNMLPRYCVASNSQLLTCCVQLSSERRRKQGSRPREDSAEPLTCDEALDEYGPADEGATDPNDQDLAWDRFATDLFMPSH